MDCPDRSDESGCFTVDVDDSYLKDMPPGGSKTGSNLGRLPVDVGVDLLAITDIHEVASTITVQFRLHLTWRDARLTFRNLKETSSANALSKEDKERLWRPTLVMYNALGPLHTVVDEETKAEVVREGEPEVNGIEEQQAGAASFIMLLRFFSHFLAVRDLNKS